MVWDIFKGTKQNPSAEISVPPLSARDEFLNEPHPFPLIEGSDALWQELQTRSPQVHAAFMEILDLCPDALRAEVRALGEDGKYFYALVDSNGKTKHSYWLVGRDDDQDAARAAYIRMRRSGYIDVAQEPTIDGKLRKIIKSGYKALRPRSTVEQKRAAG